MRTGTDAPEELRDGLRVLRHAAASAPLLAVDEETRLARLALAGDQRALDQLLRAHFRLVLSIAKQFSAQCAHDELVSEGMLGLLHAARRFDPARGTRFAVYAAWWIRAYMRNYSLANRRIVRAPSTRAARTLLSGMSKLEQNVLQRTGARPDAEAIANAFGVEVEHVHAVNASMQGRDVAWENVSDSSAGEVARYQPTPETILADADAQRVLSTRVRRAVSRLPSRERRVVEERHLGDESRTLSEIGATLGVSRERIRQLERKACGTLRRVLAVA